MEATQIKERELMTEEEIHVFGIQIVLKELDKEGYEVIGCNLERNVNPQIIARMDGQLAFIHVRTAVYPHKGSIAGILFKELIASADKHGAICYLASVGIANAEGIDEKGWSTPAKDVNYYVSYDGLLVFTYRDRVRGVEYGREAPRRELKVIH